MVLSGLGVLVGSDDGRTILALRGRVNVHCDTRVVFEAGSVVLTGIVGSSHIVCTCISHKLSQKLSADITLLVSTWNLVSRIILVIFWIRSAVPI